MDNLSLVVKASGRLFYYCIYYREIKGWIVTEKFIHENELWLILYFFDIILNVFTLRSLYKNFEGDMYSLCLQLCCAQHL